MSKLVPIYYTKIHTLPGIDGRIILKWSIRIGLGSMDCIDQTQVSDKWRALVNVIMNLCVPYKCEEFLH
jgi:hypothetical protein